MLEPLAYLDSLQGSGIRPGLGRIRALLRTLGRPEQRYPSVIVAGTNGKGSTAATLASILTQSGYRTGLYTSPHLVDIRERWMIDGSLIAEDALDEAILALGVAAKRIGITPTYFEALTIIAFLAFARARCDVAVLEVGMGGRLDATNVVRPRAALLTPIALDHTEWLGNTLRKIAGEKSGVIHRGAIVLTSNRDPVVLEVLSRRASKFGSKLHVVPEEVRIEEEPFVLHTPRERYELVTPLRGAFQRDNIAVAVRAAEELSETFNGITREAIVSGVSRTVWRGRLEHHSLEGKNIWIDGCHNPHAVRAIVPFIADVIPSPRLLILGIMSDKDVRHVAGELAPLFRRVITTEPYPPRSFDASSLAELIQSMGVEATAERDPAAAMARALQASEPSIFVGGSLYLAGAALAFLEARGRR